MTVNTKDFGHFDRGEPLSRIAGTSATLGFDHFDRGEPIGVLLPSATATYERTVPVALATQATSARTVPIALAVSISPQNTVPVALAASAQNQRTVPVSLAASLVAERTIPTALAGLVAFTSLTAAGNGANLASYATASIAPSANALVLAAVSNSISGTPGQPTLTGNGLTWVLVDDCYFDNSGTQYHLWVYRAMGASPSVGAVTIDFGGVTQAGCVWSIVQATGTDTTGTDGSGAIVQTAISAEPGSAATSVSATLGAAITSGNVPYLAAAWEADEASTGVGGWTALSNASHAGPSSAIQTAWNNSSADNSGSVTYTTSSQSGMVVIEVKAASSLTAGERTVPTSLAVSIPGERTVPTALAVSTVSERTVPTSLAASTTNQRTVPTAFAVSIVGERTVPASLAVATTNNRTVPVSLAVSALGERTVPIAVAVSAVNERTLPTALAVSIVDERTIPLSLATMADSERSVPVSMEASITEERVVSLVR